MNKIIGITGGMAAGKTTLAHQILKKHPNYVYIDVDIFRRNLFNNKNYVDDLKNVIPPLNQYERINSFILNKYIYNNPKYMQFYKDVLYRYLFNQINNYNDKTILVDWALILNDKIEELFTKILYIQTDLDTRLSRLKNSDLSKAEIIKRFKLQEIKNIEKYQSSNFMIVNNQTNIQTIDNFITGMECKFTLPENSSKAIWEITHQCNYGCSYCIFSCNNLKIENELTTNECFRIIDELCHRDFKHLKITGGEPFIRKDIIDVLRYASERLITDISTNASLITEEKVRQLNKLKLKMIHVSLDGNILEHESVRGQGTYMRTIKGLEKLKNSTNKVRIGSVIHLNNENNLESLVKDSIKMSADEIIFSIMEPVNGQDKSLKKTKSNNQLISEIEELQTKYRNIIVNYNFGSQPNYIKKCPAGDKFIYINNLGQVSPCPWVYENNHKFISDSSLRDNSLDKVLQDKSLVKFLSLKSEGKCYGKI